MSRAACEQIKISAGVVAFVEVDVMDDFIAPKLSPKALANDAAVSVNGRSVLEAVDGSARVEPASFSPWSVSELLGAEGYLANAAAKFDRNRSKQSSPPCSPNNRILRSIPSFERNAESELPRSLPDTDGAATAKMPRNISSQHCAIVSADVSVFCLSKSSRCWPHTNTLRRR